MTLNSYYAVVEEAIRQLGINPEEARGKEEGQWDLKKGDLSVWIDLFWSKQNNEAYFQVMAPIMEIPPQVSVQNELFKDLLEINDRLYAVSFSIYNNWVWLKTLREAEGMDPNEAVRLILRVGNYGELYKQELLNKYGGFTPPSAPPGPTT